jgi:hypothetical protein
MTEFKAICAGQKNCPSTVSTACNCGNTVILLCNDCAATHILDPHPHMFIDLDLAIQLLTGSSYEFDEIQSQNIKIRQEITAYINKLKDFRTKITDFKADILKEIESAVSLSTSKIDQLLSQSYLKLDQINQILSQSSCSESDILQAYNSRGIKALFQTYADSLAIHDHEIKHSIAHSIRIHTIELPPESYPTTPHPAPILPTRTPFSSYLPKTSIFTAKLNTKELIKYDFSSNSLTSYSLDTFIDRPFQHSATCILPSGRILIAGGYKSGLTYRINIDSNPPECLRLSNLNFPRGLSKLIYYEGLIYIFGGNTGWGACKKAEKMRLEETSWTRMPNMKEAREDFGVYINDRKIYIIGGLSNTTVELYDIDRDLFSFVEGVKVPRGGMVCEGIEDRIFAVGFSHVLEYSKEFEEIERKENVKHRFPHCFSEVIVRDGKMIFVNSAKSKVYCFDAHNKSLQECLKF